MAYKIAGHRIEAHCSPSADDLRRVFEAAVREIHQSDLSATKTVGYRTPIVSKARLLGISQTNAEKRALYAAARALAQLWKL